MTTRCVIRLAYAGICLTITGCGDSVERSIARLGDPDVEIRRGAVSALASHTLHDKRKLAALAEATDDNDPEVQRLSINALGQLGPAAKSSLPALMAALDDEDPGVRVRAAVAVSKIAPEEQSFMSVLVSAMRDGDGPLLQEVGAMGERAAWAIPTVIELLSHESAPMRALAAQTLGRIGVADDRVMAALERSARDPHVAVESAAKDAMRRIRVDSRGESADQ